MTTNDPAILALRTQLMKNYAGHLPSAPDARHLGGDEFARTQRGNNNAYCQDNEISRFDLHNAAAELGDLVDFFRKAIALTRVFLSCSAGDSIWATTSTPTAWRD